MMPVSCQLGYENYGTLIRVSFRIQMMKYPERSDIPREPNLTSPVTMLRGYRGIWNALWKKLGIRTIRDLLFFFQRETTNVPGNSWIFRNLKLSPK